MNLALDYTGQTGDLDTEGRRLKLITGAASIEQNLRVRLRFILGSWFLDRSQGIDYFNTVFVKAPNLLLIESVFRQAILTTRGINTVDSLTATLDKETRTLSLDFTATMDTGAPLVFNSFVIGL